MRNSIMMSTAVHRVLAAALLILFLPGISDAQQSPDAELQGLPDWLILEKGRVEFEQKEFGRALYHYQLARSRRGAQPYPEAEEAIGDVYLADSELKLAERQYRKALAEAAAMAVPEDRFRVMYKIADLLLEQERFKEFMDQLLAVVEANPFFTDPKQDPMRQAMDRLYRTQGFDAVARYYRVDALFAARAHTELGWFYYRTGLHRESSIPHLLFASDIVLTRTVDELRRVDPEYEYRRLSDFLGRALGRENTRNLLESSGFFRSLYYLACASHESGEMMRQARELWQVLARTPQAGEYARLAARQLVSPWKEPTINPSIRDIENVGVN